MTEGKIIKVSGPLVVATGLEEASMYDVAKVGEKNLIGEIIELREARASIQVYEETSGVGPGEPVISTGNPLSVELGPGLIGSIYDGIQRPLDILRQRTGDRISRGITIPGLNREKKWHFIPRVKKGNEVGAGDILGVISETPVVEHRIMVPVGVEGIVEDIREGEYRVEDTVVRIATSHEKKELTLMQKWPVRRNRPVKEKLPPTMPLVTGQRVIDTFFPVAKGGTACVPGPFGSGKTVIQHELAKWSDADIIIFIGCGERGNEMADVLLSFPQLVDPRTGESLMHRTVLIANTSNMPVAAREASIYTGITIAEYFRDMGYHVSVMADSTSRWAEALREISGRLEEMPGEEGYPAYLGTRVAEFYERAGRVHCLGKEKRVGSLSVVGAVSPPGGDLSDPVVQATLRVVKVFWSLEDQLAYRRHFPAINWLTSYSLYTEDIEDYLYREIGEDFAEQRRKAMSLLQEEAELEEIVRLVGIETLSMRERLVLETARSLREDFLYQDAFHEVDTYASLKKQYYMLKVNLAFHREAEKMLEKGKRLKEILSLPVRQEIARLRLIPEDRVGEIEALEARIRSLGKVG